MRHGPRAASVVESERGSALVVTLMATSVLAALVAAGLLNTSIEHLVSAGYRDREEARCLLDAALERAAADLAVIDDWTLALNGAVQSRFVDGPASGLRRPWSAEATSARDTVDLDQVVAQASCGRATACLPGDTAALTAARPWGINNPRWRLFGYGPDTALMGGGPGNGGGRTYLVVLIGDDSGEEDGNPEADAPDGRPGHQIVGLEGHVFGIQGLHMATRLTVARGLMPADYGRGVVGGIRILARRQVPAAG